MESSAKSAGINPGQSFGRYRIIEKIGAGGMGEVYLAHDERLERRVAIKVLSAAIKSDDYSRKRFRREALALSKLNHPNIATILDYDSENELDYLVMEYIEGAPLSDRIDGGPLSEKEALPLAFQIAFALEEAHDHGVIHRDLKPNNLIVTQRGQVKVLDFGLAKFVQQPSHDSITKTAVNSEQLIIGTLAYMSPEQLRSEAVDTRTDIYSFGVVLYELCTGRRPHSETTPISLAAAVLHRPPQPPGEIKPDLSPLLQQVIVKCLEKDREMRYQSVKELLIDLRRLETPSMSASPLLAPAPKPATGMRRFLIPAGIAILFLLGLFVAIRFIHVPAQISATQPAQSSIASIVALPSKVYGAEDNQFLTDAVPNALSSYLSKVQGVETKVPPTSLDLEKIGTDTKKIAQVYGVNALISSSVTADANQLILSIQMVDPATQKVLWKENYSGSRDAYLELVRSAADGLRAMLRPAASPIAANQGASRTTESEFAFERGNYYYKAYSLRKDPKDFDAALAELQKALELDPTSARAAGVIARLYMFRLEAGAPLSEIIPQVDQWAYRALQLDYRCGDAWQALAIAEEFRPNGDPHKKLDYALKAATYNSHVGYGHNVLGQALAGTSFRLALLATREGLRLEPLYLNGYLFAAAMLARENNAAEGLQDIDRALRMEPNMSIGLLMQYWLLLRNHQFREAEQMEERLDALVNERKLHPGWIVFGKEWREYEKDAGTGMTDDARAALQVLVKEARGEAIPWPRWQIVTGNVLGMQAQHDSVDATLQTFTIRASKGIHEPYDWLLLSPELAPVRKDPRFKELLPDSKKEFQNTLKILDEAKKRKELPAYLEKPIEQLRALL